MTFRTSTLTSTKSILRDSRKFKYNFEQLNKYL